MRYTLQKYRGKSSRFRCPSCRQNQKFSRYIDNETGQYLGEDVGRCDREDKCGYHKKPKDHFKCNPSSFQSWSRVRRNEPERPISILPEQLLLQSMKNYQRNNFFLFLKSKYVEDDALRMIERYNVGTSKHWPGAAIFWQMDIHDRLRQCKIMLYDPVTGRRVKADTPAMKWDNIRREYREDIGDSDKVYFAGRSLLRGNIDDPNLQQCLFGEHLLQNSGRVAIVESEKTAIISSHHFPEYIWLATGGSNGARFTEPNVCRVLDGRDVVLFPDVGMYDKWKEKAALIVKSSSCRVIVSEFLESRSREASEMDGWDLADCLISDQDNSSSIDSGNGGQSESESKEVQTEFYLPRWEPIKGFEGF